MISSLKYAKPYLNQAAFGMLMDNRSFSSTAYRYSINGQEKVDEIAGEGNHTTALYWEYDTRLGRRWNLDPVDQISVSNYACFLNNPIRFTDPLGDKVGEGSQKEWNKQKSAVNKRLNKLERQKNRLERKDHLNARQSERLDYLSNSVSELQDAQSEMAKMEDDQVMTFHLQRVGANDDKLLELKAEGVTNRLNNDVFIKYSGSRGVAAHEIKHGYQHLVGELDQGGYTHDVYDELAGFRAELAFNRNNSWNINSYDQLTVGRIVSIYPELSKTNLTVTMPITRIIKYTAIIDKYKEALIKDVNNNISKRNSFNRMQGMGAWEGYYDAYLKESSRSYTEMYNDYFKLR